MWYHQATVLAHEPSFVRNLGLPLQRSSNRNLSSMLGHKDIKTTQVYAKITKEKLSKDVEKLSQQINNIEEFTFGNVCNDNTNVNTINGRV